VREEEGGGGGGREVAPLVSLFSLVCLSTAATAAVAAAAAAAAAAVAVHQYFMRRSLFVGYEEREGPSADPPLASILFIFALDGAARAASLAELSPMIDGERTRPRATGRSTWTGRPLSSSYVR